MLKLLLNANLSPETANILRKEFSFDVKCLLEDNLGEITDASVTELAKKEERIIVTSDLDFGQIYHFNNNSSLGVIVLRLNDQTIEHVNNILKNFFLEFKENKTLSTSLVVIEDTRYRFYKTE